MKDQLDNKNAYMHLFLTEDVKKKQTIRETQAKDTVFVFD